MLVVAAFGDVADPLSRDVAIAFLDSKVAYTETRRGEHGDLELH